VNRDQRTRIFERLRDADPAPRTELHYGSPFELLIAVILSAQATDKAVNRATEALFRAAPTPAAMLALGEDGLKAQIRTLGLFNSKAKNILETCRLLLERHGGERHPQYRLRRAHHRRRHPHLPGRQPHRPRPRTHAARGRAAAAAARAAAVPAKRPPLADPTRALRLHRAAAALPRLPDRRAVRVP
jgi:hypothetical protein